VSPQTRRVIGNAAVRHLVGWAAAAGFCYVAYKTWCVDREGVPDFLSDGYSYTIAFPFLALGFGAAAGIDVGRCFHLACLRTPTSRRWAACFATRGFLLLAVIVAIRPNMVALSLCAVFVAASLWSPFTVPGWWITRGQVRETQPERQEPPN
jgi:hypothetical protein